VFLYCIGLLCSVPDMYVMVIRMMIGPVCSMLGTVCAWQWRACVISFVNVFAYRSGFGRRTRGTVSTSGSICEISD
jgi:tetrahydromethanopterin S-methyltransferase subunit C